MLLPPEWSNHKEQLFAEHELNIQVANSIEMTAIIAYVFVHYCMIMIMHLYICIHTVECNTLACVDHAGSPSVAS